MGKSDQDIAMFWSPTVLLCTALLTHINDQSPSAPRATIFTCFCCSLSDILLNFLQKRLLCVGNNNYPFICERGKWDKKPSREKRLWCKIYFPYTSYLYLESRWHKIWMIVQHLLLWYPHREEHHKKAC